MARPLKDDDDDYDENVDDDDDARANLGSTGSTGQSQGVAEAIAQRVKIRNMQGLVIVLFSVNAAL